MYFLIMSIYSYINKESHLWGRCHIAHDLFNILHTVHQDISWLLMK